MVADSGFTCGFCAAADGTPLFTSVSETDRRRQWLRCQVCQSVSPSPRPTSAELFDAYNAQYYGEGERKFLPPVEAVIELFRDQRARFASSLVPAGGRLLDVGCGNGNFLERCANRGLSVAGTELPGAAAERARKRLGNRLHVGSLMSACFAEKSLDLVMFWHVYEHLDQPALYLEESCRILKPGGRLVLALPNIESGQARIFRGSWLHLDPPRHLFFQGPSALTRAAESRGFAAEKFSHFSLEQNVFGWLQSSLNLVDRKRDLLYEYFKGNVEGSGVRVALHLLAAAALFLPSLSAASIESSLGHGGTYLAVFRKK